MISDILIAIFYQPFLNALVVIYDVLGQVIGNADMGIAVIIFSLMIRLLLLPLTLASTQSEDDKRRIGRAYDQIEKGYKTSEPLKFQQLKRNLIKENRSTIRFELINLGIQIAIALILWRIFSKGLEGADLHLLYKWVPQVTEPFNLMFMGIIDLSKPNLNLNLITSALLFLAETLELTFSPLPPTREDRIVQFLLPIIVFGYLYTMPSGKKLFLITTLTFSICFILLREVRGITTLFLKRNKS